MSQGHGGSQDGERSTSLSFADHPWISLVTFLALSCYAILSLCQAAGSVVYRITQGLPLTWQLLGQVFDVSHDLPVESLSAVYSLPSALEEVGSRGVILTLFIGFYSKRCYILIAAGGFAVLHLLNLVGGRGTV